MAESAPAQAPVGEPGVARTLAVALLVCAVCAGLLTATVVALRPYQLANQQREREAKIRALVADIPGLSELLASAGGAALELRALELASGAYAPEVDPEALLEPGATERAARPLPKDRDPVGLGSVPRHVSVYVIERDGALHTVLLPIRGQGYLSAIEGYLAVAGDGTTVRGLTITRQEETPGLGAMIQDPAWTSLWRGKRLRDAEGSVRIRVVQEAPAADTHEAAYQVQGISGATKTGDGVREMVRFWAGPDGYGPYLDRLRREGSPP